MHLISTCQYQENKITQFLLFSFFTVKLSKKFTKQKTERNIGVESQNKRLTIKLEDELSKIRKAYKTEVQRCGSDFSLWLCDNYYLLERYCRLSVRSIRFTEQLPAGEEGLPRCYVVSLHIVRDGVLPDPRMLEQQISEAGLYAAELFALKAMLRAALITCCKRACESSDAGLLSSAIKSFTRLEDVDFSEIVERCSVVERTLSSEQCGVYPEMSEKTRRLYREAVCNRAKKQGITEDELAKQIVAEADEKGCHVGELLKLQTDYSKRGAVFLVLEALLPLIGSIVAGVVLKNAFLLLLLYLPLWEIIKCLTDYFSRLKVPVSYLPRMEEKPSVSPDCKTLIVVSMLLPAAHKAGQLRKHLEQLKKTNGVQNVKIVALADLRGADMPTRPEDDADIAASLRIIEALNKKYGGGFLLAVRRRTYSKTQREYTGRERKRGAIAELVRAVKGTDTEFLSLKGDDADLRSYRYICALDYDTRLPMDAVSQLTAIAAHPLNRAKINPETKRVESGYGIFAPYIGTSLFTVAPTLFSKTVGGVCGISVYDFSAAERYQDLFSRGTFCGKGLIDINAAYTILEGALKSQTVLSHDILEGELLRTAFVSDVEFTDAAVGNPKAYFDRQNRWIRGDWQNIIYLKKGVKADEKGRTVTLGRLSRFKLFDNLRRSLTPVCCALLLLCAPFFEGMAAWLMIVISISAVIGGEVLSALRAFSSGGAPMLSRRFYSDTFPVAKANFARAFLWLMLLMQNAYTCLKAIVSALWRLLVTKRNLLLWTVSSDSERSSKKASYVRSFVPSIVAGLFLIFFGGWALKILGALYFLSPLFSRHLGREKTFEKEKLGEYSREKLFSYAAAMWKYFDTLCSSDDNYLPPDNLQEAPVFRTAHRTSPTNIGLMLVSCLAAHDLGFIDAQGLCKKVDNTLSTVEKLEKYKGNLLNWYNTETAKPLYPRYASTVDSGNFLCCLVALRQGLLEYVAQCPELKELIARVTRLIADTDITAFYNERRKLFSIGLNVEDGKMSESYYDLFMSEARMTGYFAVSARLVSKKHWGSLSRMLSKDGNYTGPLSWTGTMFEYYMPNIFLPSYRGTLSYEALRFCSRCQRRLVRRKDIPFGMSESCFYAFDNKLDYQYKAHGVQKLALKKGMNADTVVSPYSTFLLLPFQPETAMRNLRKLEKYDLVGKYGFYEAIDFTPERTDGQDGGVVKCYMAHHVGMSLLSVLNALKDNILQKRFMLDEEMSAGEFLLHEKIEPGASVFKDIYKKDIPQRSLRVNNGVFTSDTVSPLMPVVRCYTGPQWAMFVSDCGSGHSLYNGLCVNKKSEDLLRRPDGVFAHFQYGTNSVPFTRCADPYSKAGFAAEFSGNGVKLFSKLGFIDCLETAGVLTRAAGEQRVFSVRNNSKTETQGVLRIYFEPSLARDADEKAHPAFSKIFLEGFYDRENALALFCRKSRSSGDTVWLAAGFYEPHECDVIFDREYVLRRPDGVFSLSERGRYGSFAPAEGVDKCCCFELPVTLSPRQQFTASLFILGASSLSEATEAALKLRKTGAARIENLAPCAFSQTSLEGIVAGSVLPYLLYGKEDSREHIEAVVKGGYAVSDLWRAGISGDNPIIYAAVEREDDLSRLKPYLLLCDKLRKASVKIDVAVVYSEGGEYGSPMLEKLFLLLRDCHIPPDDRAGGLIHLLDLKSFPERTDALLKASACCIASLSGERLRLPPRVFRPSRIYPVQSVSQNDNDFEGDAYRIYQNPQLPWCHALSNMSFGTLVSDMSLGYTFAVNAAENKLTPWFNDTRTDNRGELLLLKYNGKIYDLALGADATFTDEAAVYTGSIEELTYSLTVSVPPRGMKKEMTVSIKNASLSDKVLNLLYYCEPVTASYSDNLRPSVSGNCLLLSGSFARRFSGYTALSAAEGTEVYSTNRADILSGAWKSSLSLSDGVCAAVGRTVSLAPNGEGSVRFVLAFGRTPDSAVKMSSIDAGAWRVSGKMRIETPDKNLNLFFNSLLKHQIVASRVYSRTGFYQCGGAYGFRDQLQDVCALIMTEPELCKRQILRCCAVQFPAGDVLHWWHPCGAEGFRGVRTTCSDDYLWLPYAVAEYVTKTGDEALLRIRVPFIDGNELASGESDRYALYSFGHDEDTVYGHCKRTLSRCFVTRADAQFSGEHGLLLMRGGDWNDGFNRIGTDKKGESVWLSQFAVMVMKMFSAVAGKHGDRQFAENLLDNAAILTQAIEETSYNGKWYIRAFLKDGKTLGDEGRGVCEIDSLCQSFAVLAGLPDRERRRSALFSALTRLVDYEHGVVRLFTPAFARFDADIGYTSAYPRGVRENGGQYTHAAVWLAMALFCEGLNDEGYSLLKILNPYEKYKSGAGGIYKTEPYALCGDVYEDTAPGRGGWSLYTGSAAWYFRVVYEMLFGIRQHDGYLYISPRFPRAWDECAIELTRGDAVCHILYRRAEENALLVDGESADAVPLDGKNHDVLVKFKN